jgi:50S ribosomal protein L16 3-hydroxylase
MGDLSLRQFLRRHWQRQPLLVRQASSSLGAGAELALTSRELFALAKSPDVESRLVFSPGSSSSATGNWRLRPGPFNRLPPRRQPGWSLLVQGVDLHLPAARALMDCFRFIPDARLDDLMISFASDGGGVGPHVDSYDVFLLQVEGKRRWRVRPPAPVSLLPHAPLKILADFEPQQTWLLEPGDMLYLPPGWGHEGTAVGECMTCSIGFRSPSMAELRQAFFTFLADSPPQARAPGAQSQRRYRDKTLAPATHPAEIPEDMARTLGRWLREYQPTPQLIERFIGHFLTEPKPSVWFDAPSTPAAISDLVPSGSARRSSAAAAHVTLVLDRRTRMLYRADDFYINGEVVDLPRGAKRARALLRMLADQRRLDAVQTADALRIRLLRTIFEDWLASGWLKHAGT